MQKLHSIELFSEYAPKFEAESDRIYAYNNRKFLIDDSIPRKLKKISYSERMKEYMRPY